MSSRTELELKQFELEKKWRESILAADPRDRGQVFEDAYKEVTAFMDQNFEYHENLHEKAQKQFQFCELLAEGKGKIKFLDIGCSSGKMVGIASDKGWDAYGIDVDPQAIALAKKENPSISSHFFSGEIQNLEESGFDLAFNSDLIEHLHPDDVAVFFRNIHQRLSYGGMVFTSTPYRLAGPKDISKLFLPKGQKAEGLHLKEYLLKELVSIYREAGFNRVETFFFHPMSSRSISVGLNAWNTSFKIFLESLLLMSPNFIRRSIIEKVSSGLTFSITVGVK